MNTIFLGCIADDFTGATDLANNLVRAGMRVLQTIGVPEDPLTSDVDAVVVALKSRTIAPNEAVQQSLGALRWLKAQGAQQIYFKYCSTFDSTPKGNIGPVTEALMDALATDFTISTPAFPDNHRTVFKGNLFVGEVLLNESGMQNHPLTPMTDPNLVRVLQAQVPLRKVGLIDYKVVAQGGHGTGYSGFGRGDWLASKFWPYAVLARQRTAASPWTASRSLWQLFAGHQPPGTGLCQGRTAHASS